MSQEEEHIPRSWPTAATFAGRRREAGHARERLRRDGLLLIVGRRGVGKSTLASFVGAAEYPAARRAWVDCRYEAQDGQTILWLAASRWPHQPLLEFLDSTAERTSLPRLVERAVRILAPNAPQPYLLCLDALHHLYEREGVAALVRALAHLASDGGSRLRLIITADYPPPFLPEFGYLQLGQAAPEITGAIFSRHHLHLDDTRQQEIYAVTGGTPRLIEHYARLAEDAPDFSTDPLRNRYLTRYFYQRYKDLPPDERQILIALAVIAAPASPGLIKQAVPEIEDARLVIYHLQDLGWIDPPTSDDVRVAITPALRHFCLDVAGAGTLRRIHHNLAAHFEYQGDILAAAEHYTAAGETEYAARFLLRYAAYVDRAAAGERLAALVERLLSLPVTRALPPEVQEPLRKIVAAET